MGLWKALDMENVTMMNRQPNKEKMEHARSMVLKISTSPAGVGSERSIVGVCVVVLFNRAMAVDEIGPGKGMFEAAWVMEADLESSTSPKPRRGDSRFSQTLFLVSNLPTRYASVK